MLQEVQLLEAHYAHVAASVLHVGRQRLAASTGTAFLQLVEVAYLSIGVGVQDVELLSSCHPPCVSLLISPTALRGAVARFL